MNRSGPEPDPGATSVRTDWTTAVALVLIYGVCLVNAGVAIDFTRRLAGTQPESLERRYGDLRIRLDGVERVCYITDKTVNFLNVRYALVPTIIDIGHIDFRREDRSIVGYHLDAIVDEALSDPPLQILCEFDDPDGLGGFVDGLSTAAARRDLRVETTYRSGRLTLLSVGG